MQKKVNIYDREIPCELSYRPIQYPRIEFKTGSLLLVLPQGYKNEEDLIEKYKDWIYRKHTEILASMEASGSKKLVSDKTDTDLQKVVHTIVSRYTKGLGLQVNKVSYKKMRSKWASCSSNKTLTINPVLKHLPEDLIEYVIYHEMAHLAHRRHSKEFWQLIKKRFNDHQDKEEQLFSYWFLLRSSLKQ